MKRTRDMQGPMSEAAMFEETVQPTFEAEVDRVAREAKATEDEKIAESGPTGTFTGAGLEAVEKALSKIGPLMGVEVEMDTEYPAQMDTLPLEAVKMLKAVETAVSDAIEEGVLEPEMALDISSITQDAELFSLAAEIDMLSKDAEFKRFLKAPKKEVEVSVEVTEEAPEMSDEEIDMMVEEEMPAEDLFASRM